MTDNRPVILVVDDTKENLTVIGGLLDTEYRVRVANSGERALKVATGNPRPDVILLDVMMPGMDGYQTLAKLREESVTQDIPVIFVTAMDADEDEERGLLLGAVDYVTKPIKPAILLARVKSQIELKFARDRLAHQNEFLEAEVARRTQENELIKDVSLQALALLAEKRDNETGNHLNRTRAYVELLMNELQHDPRYAAELHAENQLLIAKAAPLHDIGKVGIPDAVLLKPGKLTSDEFEVMKTHAAIGGEAIDEAIQRVASSNTSNPKNASSALVFLQTARSIALFHHEKWDGSGYPRGIAAEEIPLPARLMALADVFDALICKRHYKDAVSIERTIDIIREGRGRHFDPNIVDAFLARVEDFTAIAQRHQDIRSAPS
jgi:putative two-component system response regulator